MANSINILWNLSLAELQEICSAIEITPIGTRGDLIKSITEKYSLDKIEMIIPNMKKGNKVINKITDLGKAATAECKTCGK